MLITCKNHETVDFVRSPLNVAVIVLANYPLKTIIRKYRVRMRLTIASCISSIIPSFSLHPRGDGARYLTSREPSRGDKYIILTRLKIRYRLGNRFRSEKRAVLYRWRMPPRDFREHLPFSFADGGLDAGTNKSRGVARSSLPTVDGSRQVRQKRNAVTSLDA